MRVAYATGDGVPKDNAEAVAWFPKSAEQANPDAQSNLDVVFFSGLGVPKSLAEAHYWFSVASANGHETARKNLALIEENMTPREMAEAAKLASLRTPK